MSTEDSGPSTQVVRPPETFWQRFIRDLIAVGLFFRVVMSFPCRIHLKKIPLGYKCVFTANFVFFFKLFSLD
jgi:hypothetical protein